MNSFSRRSLLLKAVPGLVSLRAASQLLNAQEAPKTYIPQGPLKPIKEMSQNGQKFMIQMLRELVYHHFYATPQISWKAVFTSRIVLPGVLSNSDHKAEIANTLKIQLEEVALLNQSPDGIYKPRQWQNLAQELRPEEAIRLYDLASLTQYEDPAFALARSGNAEAIAEEKIRGIAQSSTPPQLDLKQELGLYFDPKGPYGLGGTEEQQQMARNYLQAIRNNGVLKMAQVVELTQKLPSQYATTVYCKLRDYAIVRDKLHIKILPEELAEVEYALRVYHGARLQNIRPSLIPNFPDKSVVGCSPNSPPQCVR